MVFFTRFCLLGLFPLDGSGSVVPSLQLHPVFDAVSSRVPPSITMSCFISFGDKGWDNFKTLFKLRGLSFSFCLKGRGEPSLEARERRKRLF